MYPILKQVERKGLQEDYPTLNQTMTRQGNQVRHVEMMRPNLYLDMSTKRYAFGDN
jgi:hypothetical protein